MAIQTETAVRHIASSYPYTSRNEGELSLRDNAEVITQRLSDEITDRVRAAASRRPSRSSTPVRSTSE